MRASMVRMQHGPDGAGAWMQHASWCGCIRGARACIHGLGPRVVRGYVGQQASIRHEAHSWRRRDAWRNDAAAARTTHDASTE